MTQGLTADEVIGQYQHWIFKILHRAGVPQHDFEDCYQHALLYLLERLDRYDPARGGHTNFVYQWIRGGISDWYRRRRDWLVEADDEYLEALASDDGDNPEHAIITREECLSKIYQFLLVERVKMRQKLLENAGNVNVEHAAINAYRRTCSRVRAGIQDIEGAENMPLYADIMSELARSPESVALNDFEKIEHGLKKSLRAMDDAWQQIQLKIVLLEVRWSQKRELRRQAGDKLNTVRFTYHLELHTCEKNGRQYHYIAVAAGRARRRDKNGQHIESYNPRVLITLGKCDDIMPVLRWHADELNESAQQFIERYDNAMCEMRHFE